MTTASTAHAVFRSVIDGATITDNGSAVPLRYYGDNNDDLPDVPTPFVYVVFDAFKAEVIEMGGAGRGSNRHRNFGTCDAFVFVPKGTGMKRATDIAETIAALFRSYRLNGVTCETATVFPGGNGSDIKPDGMDSEVGNYLWAGCQIEFYHDVIG